MGIEVRELQIAGVIRPQDIASNNTVPYEKIAEACQLPVALTDTRSAS